MRQRRHHPPQCGQAFIACQLRLQRAGLGLILDEDQLTRLPLQRPGCQRNSATAAQRHFVVIVLTWSKALLDQVTPELPLKWLAEQLTGRGIGFTHNATPVQNDHAARQQIEYVLQPPGQARLLCQLTGTLRLTVSQLTLEQSDLPLQQRMGSTQLLRH